MKSINDHRYDRVQLTLFLIYVFFVYYFFILKLEVFGVTYGDFLRFSSIFIKFNPFSWSDVFCGFLEVCIELSVIAFITCNAAHFFFIKSDRAEISGEDDKKKSRIKFLKKNSINFALGAILFFSFSYFLPFGDSVINDNSKIIYVSVTTYWFIFLLGDLLKGIVLTVL